MQRRADSHRGPEGPTSVHDCTIATVGCEATTLSCGAPVAIARAGRHHDVTLFNLVAVYGSCTIKDVRTTFAKLLQSIIRNLLIASAALLAAGCATTHYTVNRPLASADGSAGYRFANIKGHSANSDSLFVSVSISGGGLRAASLGYGVLQALRDIEIEWEGTQRRLVDEVDLVIGVSGGSLVASYFAIHEDRMFDTFKSQVLQADLQGQILRKTLSPWGLWRLTSPRFGRSDVLEEVLDEQVFHGATFGDLVRRATRPYLIVSAADMTSGGRFEFVQDQFDLICSDLATFPVARAVAASSAVPIVLSPVTLRNFTDQCGTGEVVANSAHASRIPSRDPPFVHLLDGGLADNVSAHGPLDFSDRHSGVIGGTRAAGFRGVRRALFIVVNAETSARDPADDTADVPGLLRTALALADVPINRYSEESLGRLRATIRHWQRAVCGASAQERADTFEIDTEFHLVEISLAASPDPVEHEQLLSIPTALRLDSDSIEMLTAYGRRSTRESLALNAFLASLAALGSSSACADTSDR